MTVLQTTCYYKNKHLLQGLHKKNQVTLQTHSENIDELGTVGKPKLTSPKN